MTGQSRPEIGVLTINFGEPADATLSEVVPFLERIFLLNAGLEPDEAAAERARDLARRRAPGLIEEYEEIGGSPLNAQADAQAAALEVELKGRGVQARVYSAFQFTPPFVHDRVIEAHNDGVDALVALPVYPICGESTTAAALRAVRDALGLLEWAPRYVGIGGWHAQREYAALRADSVRDFLVARDVDLLDPETLLYFSAHGTPIKYLDDGSRYDRYVEEHCRAVAVLLGVERYVVGFQNHDNRRVEWTQPGNEELVRSVEERRLVVVPISFMHEQSETLAELDGEFREMCEGLGKECLRVPIPHDSPRFAGVLADLVANVLSEGEAPEPLKACACVGVPDVRCTNGGRTFPPSPYRPRTAEHAT